MDSSKRLNVFVDTSFLRGISKNDVNFKSLLAHSINGKVNIHISEIVLEEWRTQQVKEVNRSNRKTEEMQEKNLISREITLDICQNSQETSKNKIECFVRTNKLKVIPILGEHYRKVTEAYFEGYPPFSQIKGSVI